MINAVLRRVLAWAAFALLLLSYFLLRERLEAWRDPAPSRRPSQDDKTPSQDMLSDIRQWQKAAKIRKVAGLVFYGRRRQASILDCYLKRNLAKNGGLLDEVIWLQRTQDEADLAFLDKLIDSEADYRRVDVERTEGGFASAYDGIEDDILYVKVDTDIVFIEDTTILSMVHTRATRPDFYIVGANTINQPLSSWLHWGLGVIHPYLPETEMFYPPDEERQGKQGADWRASRLPKWKASRDFNMSEWSPPDGRKHRWLPVPHGDDHILDGTPIMTTTYDAHTSTGWWNWVVGAQQHYSFLENLETGQLWRYRFYTWDYRDLRMGIQLVALTGKDINDVKPIAPDDEDYFCVKMPQKLGRAAVASGGGVAAHFSFDAQKDGMAKTDILDRYRSYAQEKVCNGTMLWTSEADDPGK
ncbi:hypothetical protein ED733_007743 [Metarhizium rileyi]|uniref:Uncharacterized protein n=1 Tax=Metarhizium rileyi (strain RCEF 4871) TaxID=1649241 RepID=A0A5C6GF38_METRR|nr:hypothetical protein ED733_007743 [Metarhizium rileyi]